MMIICFFVFGYILSGRASPYMKLNGAIPDGEVIFRDTILSIGIVKNVKIQAPKYKQIPNDTIQ
jgi:hypothetical protein